MTTKRTRKRARKASAPRQRRKVTPEKAVCRQIEDYLTARRIRYFSNEVYCGRTASGAWMRVGEPGMADYSAFVHATGNLFFILHIEVKAAHGRQSQTQKMWQQAEESDGRFYILATSYEDVEKWLKEHKCL